MGDEVWPRQEGADLTDYELIRQAIVDRKQVTLTYHEHYREMCPHVIGNKNGRAHALFFQFGGTSSSGLPSGGEWRCMDINAVTDVVVRDGDWHTDTNHTEQQTCVDEIDVEVDYSALPRSAG
jgi:hypothetical protein